MAKQTIIIAKIVDFFHWSVMALSGARLGGHSSACPSASRADFVGWARKPRRNTLLVDDLSRRLESSSDDADLCRPVPLGFGCAARAYEGQALGMLEATVTQSLFWTFVKISRRYSILLAVGWALSGACQAQSASFDCAQAKSRTEIAICNDYRLPDEDKKLSQIFGNLNSLLGPNDRSKLKGEQIAWLKQRDAICGKFVADSEFKECLFNQTKDRKDQLAVAWAIAPKKVPAPLPVPSGLCHQLKEAQLNNQDSPLVSPANYSVDVKALRPLTENKMLLSADASQSLIDQLESWGPYHEINLTRLEGPSNQFLIMSVTSGTGNCQDLFSLQRSGPDNRFEPYSGLTEVGLEGDTLCWGSYVETHEFGGAGLIQLVHTKNARLTGAVYYVLNGATPAPELCRLKLDYHTILTPEGSFCQGPTCSMLETVLTNLAENWWNTQKVSAEAPSENSWTHDLDGDGIPDKLTSSINSTDRPSYQLTWGGTDQALDVEQVFGKAETWERVTEPGQKQCVATYCTFSDYSYRLSVVIAEGKPYLAKIGEGTFGWRTSEGPLAAIYSLAERKLQIVAGGHFLPESSELKSVEVE